MVPEALDWALLRLDGRLAVHVAPLPLEQLALVTQPVSRLERELVGGSGQPPRLAQALLGWLPLLVQEARWVESQVA